MAVKLHVYLFTARTEYLLNWRLGGFWSLPGLESENKISASAEFRTLILHMWPIHYNVQLPKLQYDVYIKLYYVYWTGADAIAVVLSKLYRLNR
jgi:hypothetical protein